MKKTPLRKQATSAPTMEMGFSGVKKSNGIIQEEFLPALQFPKQNQIYKEMSYNDPIIGGMLFAIEMIIRKVEWSVEPASDSATAMAIAEFVDSCRHDMEKSWAETINDILSFLPYGFCVTEKLFKRRAGAKISDRRYKSKYQDGMWGWRKFPMRAQDTVYRWVFEGDDPSTTGIRSVKQGDHAELAGLIQKSPNTGELIFIPRDKFLLFRTNSRKDNPEGISILRQAYRPWYFKKTIEEIEAIGIERNLKGIPILHIPPAYLSPNASAEQRAVVAAMEQIGTSLRANEQACVVMPLAYDERGNELFKLELLGSKQSAGAMFDTDKIIQRYSTSVAQTVLADFIMLGNTSVGSYALSNNKVKMFHAAISAWLDNIADAFNKDAIPQLVELNGWDVLDAPQLKYGTIDNFSIEEITNFFAKLTDSGFLDPTAELRDWVLSKVDAPSVGDTRMESVEERVAGIKNQGLLDVEDKKSTTKLQISEDQLESKETETETPESDPEDTPEVPEEDSLDV